MMACAGYMHVSDDEMSAPGQMPVSGPAAFPGLQHWDCGIIPFAARHLQHALGREEHEADICIDRSCRPCGVALSSGEASAMPVAQHRRARQERGAKPLSFATRMNRKKRDAATRTNPEKLAHCCW